VYILYFYVFFVLAYSFLFSCLLVTALVVSCFILRVVPPGVYIVYYLEYWVVSLVMHVVHMDSFFTNFIYVVSF
jgi:hypothetical protein